MGKIFQRKRDYALILNVEAVRDDMERKGLSNSDLAKLIGSDPHTISNYFKHPSNLKLDVVADIADALSSTPYLEDYIIRVKTEEVNSVYGKLLGQPRSTK